MDYLKDLHEVCDTLSRELGEANEKVRQGGGKLSGADLDYIDKLTHAIKSVKTTIAMVEAEEGGSFNDGMDRGSYGMYPHWNGGSYARGRNARRDGMGRYSSRGYSRDDDMVAELKELMHDAPDERTKQEFQRFIDKIERMM